MGKQRYPTWVHNKVKITQSSIQEVQGIWGGEINRSGMNSQNDDMIKLGKQEQFKELTYIPYVQETTGKTENIFLRPKLNLWKSKTTI